MKIELNVQLTGIDGITPISIDPKNRKVLTLKEVCIQSILAPTQGDTEKTKLEKWDLFKKLRDNKDMELMDLKAEEIVLIKKAIGIMQPPLIMGQAFEMLEK